MEIMSMSKLVMDDTCKNIEDVYQVAFYNIHNFDIEKQICLNIEQKNCNKFRINDLNWISKQDTFSLPDVLIMSSDTVLSDEQEKLLIDSNIKIQYIHDNILESETILQGVVAEIERKIYKSKTLKYFQQEKKEIEKIEQKYEHSSSNNLEVSANMISDMLELLKKKDEVTYQHVTNVSAYIDVFLEGLPESKKLSNQEITFLKQAALIHDIGKLTIPKQILRKETSLTDEEYVHMQSHVSNHAYLFNNQLMQDYKDVALCHHERYDGKGYPNQLKGEEIPYFARIISVLDAFEAMTGNRKYMKDKQKNLYEALNTLKINAGKQFDPMIVNTFIRGVAKNVEFRETFNNQKGGSLKCS